MFNILILIIFCLCFAILSWRKILWGLVIILFLLPIYLVRFKIGFLPMTLLEAMILILFAVWLVKSRFQIINYEFRDKFKGWILPMGIFLLAATVSVYFSASREAALGIWKAYFIEPILFLLVLTSEVKNKKDLKILFYSLGTSAIYLGVLAIYQKFTGYLIPNADWFAPETRRVTGVFGFPNAMGLYLAPIAVLYFGLLIKTPLAPLIRGGRNKDWLKVVFYIVVFVLSLLAIIFAVSEGAMVAVVAGIVFIMLFYPKTRYLLLMLLILGSIFIQLDIGADFKNLIIEKATLQDVSGKIRLEMWGETLEMLKDNFYTGAGLANYQNVVAPYHRAGHIEIYLYPHNFILNFWSELGILGLIGFLWIVIKFFWQGAVKIYKNNKQSFKGVVAISLMGAMIAILIHGLVDVPYFKNDLAILFWFIVGALIILENFDKVEKIN